MIVSNDPIISSSTCYKCSSGISGIRISLCDYLLSKKIVNYITNKNTILFPKVARFTWFYLDGKKIDNGIIILFPKGRSFTGEIIIEMYVHSNNILVCNIINKIISKFSKYGLRLSRRGEFLKRAYYNGKICFNEIIRLYYLLSKNKGTNFSSLVIRYNSLIRSKFRYISNSIFNIILYIENYINFRLFDMDNYHTYKPLVLLKSLLVRFKNMKINNFHIFRKCLKVCIVGHENVGKSSIFNYLSKKSISMVSKYKGTTRNNVSKVVFIKNSLPINLIDTAGFKYCRNSLDIKINSNVIRTITKSDLVINVSDTNSFTKLPLRTNVIYVINKVDLICKKVTRPEGFVFTSCNLNIGISELYLIIKKKLYFYNSLWKYLDKNNALFLLKISRIIIMLLKKSNINIDLILSLTKRFFFGIKKLLNSSNDRSICEEIFRSFCVGK
ncbi:GTP-binding protein [Candidatus Vidania fulgoroideae]|uniref:GTP-binding protein n=1 Tax=Candidatus Vidania fulgoroideorum TaxID=881286 RepID=A0A974X7C9_9PROT|nr:GTP-binding protein [Candidatus Vidania fulgoroideae]